MKIGPPDCLAEEMPSETGPPLSLSPPLRWSPQRKQLTCTWHPQSLVTRDTAHGARSCCWKGLGGLGQRHIGVWKRMILFFKCFKPSTLFLSRIMLLYSVTLLVTCGSRYSEGALATLAAVRRAREPDSSPHRSRLSCRDGASSRGLAVGQSCREHVTDLFTKPPGLWEAALPKLTEKLQSLSEVAWLVRAEFLTTRPDCLKEEPFRAFFWATPG